MAFHSTRWGKTLLIKTQVWAGCAPALVMAQQMFSGSGGWPAIDAWHGSAWWALFTLRWTGKCWKIRPDSQKLPASSRGVNCPPRIDWLPLIHLLGSSLWDVWWSGFHGSDNMNTLEEINLSLPSLTEVFAYIKKKKSKRKKNGKSDSCSNLLVHLVGSLGSQRESNKLPSYLHIPCCILSHLWKPLAVFLLTFCFWQAHT